MYGFLDVDKKILRKLSGSFLWIPSAVMRIPTCRDDHFLVDCCFSNIVENPYLRLVLIKRLPKSFRIVNSPPLEAPRLRGSRCSAGDILADFSYARSSLQREDLSKLYDLVEILTKPREVRFRIPTFLGFRKREYVIPEERVREASRRVAKTSIEMVLKGLCFDQENVPRIEVIPVYTLLNLDTVHGTARIVIGKKVIDSQSHAAVVQSISEIRNLVEEIMSSVSTSIDKEGRS